MIINKKASDSFCDGCGNPRILTSMKDFYIDDYVVCCESEGCNYKRDGLATLRAMSDRVAREEFYAGREWQD